MKNYGKRLVGIVDCRSCPRRYDNYLPDGVKSKLWCGEFDKELKPFDGQFPSFCELPTIIDFESDDNESGSTNDIYDYPGKTID
jgi:hypothetical protein